MTDTELRSATPDELRAVLAAVTAQLRQRATKAAVDTIIEWARANEIDDAVTRLRVDILGYEAGQTHFLAIPYGADGEDYELAPALVASLQQRLAIDAPGLTDLARPLVVSTVLIVDLLQV